MVPGESDVPVELRMVSPNPSAYGVPGTLLQSVSRTRDQELTCDACLGELGGFAELTLEGRPVEEAYDLVQQHLQVCGECRKEFELLLKALECLVEPQP